jgi:hypothetical protein
MNNIKIIISAFAVILIFLLGCSKDNGVCVSSTGKTIIQDRVTQPFHTIEVYDNINLILTQDSVLDKITVEAGENLIDGITTKLDSGRLVIRNENSCNWLRSFEVPVNVYLTFTRLDTIVFQAAGNINCTNDWTNESVILDVIEGSGQINLKLQAFRTYIIAKYGTTNIQLSGYSQITTLISYSFGPLHAENLASKFTYVSSYSSNDMFVYSSVDLQVEIGNIGDVYYTGNPATISTNIYNEGRLIEF